MEIMMGSDMDMINLSIGIVPILFSCMGNLLC